MKSKQLFSPPHQLSGNRHDRSRLPSSGCFSSSCFSADRRQKYARISLALLPALLILSFLQFMKLSSLMSQEQNIGEANEPAVRNMEKGTPITTLKHSRPSFASIGQHQMHSTAPFSHLIDGIHTIQIGFSPTRWTIRSVSLRLEVHIPLNPTTHIFTIFFCFMPTSFCLPVIFFTKQPCGVVAGMQTSIIFNAV